MRQGDPGEFDLLGFNVRRGCVYPACDRVTLESLLTRSKERLSGLAHRLKVIDRYETLSKELKERIRDLAISYTAQVQ